MKGNDTIKNLSVDYQLRIGLAIIAGAAVAVIAALCAMRAAYGPLQKQDFDGKDLASIRDDETAAILNYLRVTRAATLLALILLAVAIGVAWSAPTSDPAYIKVMKIDGAIVCGKYLDGTSQALRVTSPSGADPIKLPEIKKVEWVTSC